MAVATDSPELVPPIDLFAMVESTMDTADSHVIQQREPGLIQSFLDRDHLTKGRQDGHRYASSDHLEASKRSLRSEFLGLIDQVILERRMHRKVLQGQAAQTEGLSDILTRQIQNQIEEIDWQLDLLDRQKALTVEQDGWLMQAIHRYHQGYLQGVEDRMKEEQFLTGSSIL